MKTILLSLLLSSLTSLAGPIINIDSLGEQLGGWESKGDKAADYERSGSKYRTWKPEVTPTLDGGLFISVRIDHLRGLFASDDHASLQITLDSKSNIISAQSSMAFQGNSITSDAIKLGATASTEVMGIAQVAKVGTDLLADLSSKLLREKVAEPGRVTFPAVIHHNYNLICLATGLLTEEKITSVEASVEGAKAAKPTEEAKPKGQPLKVKQDKNTAKKVGKPVELPTRP